MWIYVACGAHSPNTRAIIANTFWGFTCSQGGRARSSFTRVSWRTMSPCFCLHALAGSYKHAPPGAGCSSPCHPPQRVGLGEEGCWVIAYVLGLMSRNSASQRLPGSWYLFCLQHHCALPAAPLCASCTTTVHYLKYYYVLSAAPFFAAHRKNIELPPHPLLRPIPSHPAFLVPLIYLRLAPTPS